MIALRPSLKQRARSCSFCPAETNDWAFADANVAALYERRLT
jgi:hypothetical protein